MRLKSSKKTNEGMTYVELIVVLSIFSVMASIVMFNYGAFLGRVDIKNLSNDIALRVVQAQKDSLAGKLPPATQLAQLGPNWKPAYGFYANRITDNKSFIYFTDINQNGDLDDTTCNGNGECLNKSIITKGNYISNMLVFYQDGSSASLHDLTITFKRPDSSAIIKSSLIAQPPASPISYVEIDVVSPKGGTAKVKVYPSGRIQIN